jgi:hypothetical protein
MSNTIKKPLTFGLVILLLISFAGIASARKQGPVWQKGTVSKAAWTEGEHKYIEVDGDIYTFLPDDRVRIRQQFRTPGGQWHAVTLSLDKVYPGTEVLIRVEGKVIHQLVVEEP